MKGRKKRTWKVEMENEEEKKEEEKKEVNTKIRR